MTAKTPTPEELQRLVEAAQAQAKAALRKLPLLGPMTWLMLQQSATRNLFLGDLEWRLMPALVLDQARLHMREESPVAFITWAKLSEEAADRYRQPPHRLRPADWKSGDQIWIIDLVAPFGGGQEAIKELKEKVFPGQTLFQLVPAPEEPAQTLQW